MKLLVTALLLFVAHTLLVAQTPLQEMVKTEQEFSKTAEVKNTQDAFMEFIADDGLLFRPFAVNGKKWMQEHPGAPSDKKPLLAWQPIFAGMATAGDLGFTTGPWEFKADRQDEKPSGYGHFVTMWKKQANGTWRFVADLGISHPQSGGPQTLWQPPADTAKTTSRTVDVEKAVKDLMQRDRDFSEKGLKQGFLKAFVSLASPDVRLYRKDNLPYVGRAAAQDALTTAKGDFVWTPYGGDVSRSGDLGYTHGTYQATSSDSARTMIEQGAYLRIWKKEGGAWRIVLDVTSPLPSGKKGITQQTN